SEKTAWERMLDSPALRAIRIAISPRLAIRRCLSVMASHADRDTGHAVRLRRVRAVGRCPPESGPATPSESSSYALRAWEVDAEGAWAILQTGRRTLAS